MILGPRRKLINNAVIAAPAALKVTYCKIFIYIFIVLTWCNIGFAEYTYKSYRQNPTAFVEYFHGLGDGIGLSITMQEKIGPKFFCQKVLMLLLLQCI